MGTLRRASLARRLMIALAVMLLPLIVVAVTRYVTSRSNVGVLEAFRVDTVDESERIEAVRGLLVRADDVGELYVESGDEAFLYRFNELDQQIHVGLTDLATLDTPSQQRLAHDAIALWEAAASAAHQAVLLPRGERNDALDPFHDDLDSATSLVADLYRFNVLEVGDQITALGGREQTQLRTSFIALVAALIIALVLFRRLYRSITTSVRSLEKAAARFGADDLSHQIPVEGDDELARVGTAFNTMAGTLLQSREDLHHQATHDPLTGLPNRTVFMERLEHAVARARRRETPVSVLFLDLDGFKTINDSMGHEAGDETLIATSQILVGALRSEDTVSRLGGDEFAILLEEDVDGATRTVERLSNAFGEGWPTASRGTRTDISIGAATRQGDEGPDDVLRRADAAMYVAKNAGRGGWHVSTPGTDVEEDDRQSLRAELRRAVDRKEFAVHYQPLVDLRTGAIEAVEALVRWNHPRRGLLAPEAFLAEAERSGDIVQIDRWVLQEACRQVQSWQTRLPGASKLTVHVNVSARQLHLPGFADRVAKVLATTGLAPESLTLEITETTLVADPETAARELELLRATNVRLALDDFGTGFSSLSHLLRFPVDMIKIDRSFVSGVGDDEDRSQFVLALVSLGRTLGLEIVAEGIEEPSELAYLRSIQCVQGQGYYFAKPVDAGQLELLLASGDSLGPETEPPIVPPGPPLVVTVAGVHDTAVAVTTGADPQR